MRLSKSCSLSEVINSLRFINLDPIAFLVDTPQRIQCFGLTLVRTPFKPCYRKILVRLDPVSMKQALCL